MSSAESEKYIDVLVTNDGIALDGFGLPILISGRASIAQDIKHMIRETGLLIKMIGERNPEKIRGFMIQIENKIEDDVRIVPGTAKVVRLDSNDFLIQAKTVEFGGVEFSL